MVSKPRTSPKTKQKQKTPSKRKEKTPPASPLVETGDFLFVDLIGRTHDDSRLFETTKAEVAKADGVFNEEEVYQPKLVIVGQGWVLPGVDEELVGMKVGETKNIVLEPEKAFGIRDPKQVRTIPRGRIKSDQKVARGMHVRLGNQTGIVRHIGGGRVTVDFNPPLASHKIDYEITVIQKLTKTKEKLDALIRRRFYGVDPEAFSVSAKGKTVTITLNPDPRILLNQSIQIQKLGVTHDIETYLKDKYSKVLFVEEWSISMTKQESA
jgi:peptidylprolyl isomerase